eukprot:CAMPEP_0171124478 /NCGR_PEP_ID=MMETSP0766_2-20121228/109222_1 /TAXON_ID=439317 /ORGANISM="Gambierdiscus australes, Strain CAWD 149" /LENGTH=193 /DNA_ID=CAMNT_0011587407 /DNA_START=87 /DNA_END=665 /DNA_ORIENTATION=-
MLAMALGTWESLLQLTKAVFTSRQDTLLVLEAKRRVGGVQNAERRTVESAPLRSPSGDQRLRVSSADLRALGCAENKACFDVSWREASKMTPGDLDEPAKLVARGEQPVSVDGLIVPRGRSVELFDGSQVSILTERGNGRYGTSLIMEARFERGGACAFGTHRRGALGARASGVQPATSGAETRRAMSAHQPT